MAELTGTTKVAGAPRRRHAAPRSRLETVLNVRLGIVAVTPASTSLR